MANVKRVYLCKSDRTSSATLRIVRDALSKYECDVVEHKRGDIYDDKARDNLVESDFLLVCPPVIGKYVVTPREYRRYDKIGKGQIEQINDFSWEKGTKDQIYMILDRDLETDGLYLGRVTSTHVTNSDNWIEHGEVYTSPVHHDHLPEIFSLQGISMKGARRGYVDPMADVQAMLDIRDTQDPEWCERIDVPPVKYKAKYKAGTHTILHRKHRPMLALRKRLKR